MMGRLSALLAVAGVLVAVIAWEVAGAPAGDTIVPQRHGAAMKPPPAAMQRTDVGEWVAHVLARPVFSPDRRPASDAAEVARSGAPGLPRLTGIMVGPFGRSAIFDGNGSKAIVLSEGGRIDAYTIKSIDLNQVQVVGPDGLQRLQPTFGSAAQEVAASPRQERRIGRKSP